jgi:hypothetical protein
MNICSIRVHCCILQLTKVRVEEPAFRNTKQ